MTNTGFADVTEIAAGNGYVAGGLPVSISSSTQTAGAYKLIAADVTVTASGGGVGPFRYGVLYNDTAAGKPLLGYFDYGVSYTLPDTQAFQFDFDPVAGLLTLS